MPKKFAVRWTEYSFQLVRAIAHNWHAIVLYFTENNNARSKGFLTFLTNVGNLKKIAFLGDVLFLFKRLQKKLQSDSLTLLKMSANVNETIAALENLKMQSIPSGFQTKLEAKLVNQDDKEFLNDIQLKSDGLHCTT